MLASIAWAAMFLLAPASAGIDLPLAFSGLDGGVRRAPGALAPKVRAFVHEAEGDLRWLIRSAPAMTQQRERQT